MFVARLIRSDSRLYRSIRERIGVLDVVFFINPTLLFPIWTVMVSGMSAATGSVESEVYWVSTINLKSILLASGVTLLAAAALIRHRIGDGGAFVMRLHTVVSEMAKVSKNEMGRFATILAVAGLMLVAATSVMGRSPAPVLWAILLWIAWGILHDGKFSWGEKPLLSQISHVLASLSLFMLGWTHVSGSSSSGIISSIPYVVTFLSWIAISSVSNMKDDEKAGKKTVAVRFGPRATVAWGTLLLCFSTLVGYFSGDPVISTASAVSLPFFLVALLFTRADHVQRGTRYPVFILAFFVSVRYPWFFVAIALFYYFSKYYYYFRYNVDYPTFHVATE